MAFGFPGDALGFKAPAGDLLRAVTVVVLLPGFADLDYLFRFVPGEVFLGSAFGWIRRDHLLCLAVAVRGGGSFKKLLFAPLDAVKFPLTEYDVSVRLFAAFKGGFRVMDGCGVGVAGELFLDEVLNELPPLLW